MISRDIAFEVAKQLKQFSIALTTGTEVAGGTFALLDRHGLLACDAFGLANVAAGEMMRVDHKFEIGSISKSITSLVIHSLVDEGLVDLDVDVKTYLPWFVAGDPDGPVTARQLLAHTSGLPLGSDHLPDEAAQVWAIRDLSRSLSGNFHYSNLGYMVLGQIISSVTKQTVAQAVRTRVLEPLGIPDARVGVNHDDRAVMAIGYTPLADDRPWISSDPIIPATWFEVACADGNVAADAQELGRLAQLFLSDGELDGKCIVSESAMSGIITPQAPQGEPLLAWPDVPAVESSLYGLGLNVESIQGHHVLTHAGGMVGYATFLLADRSSGLGVVVLTNATGEYAAAQLIARVGHQMLLEAQQGQTYAAPSTRWTVKQTELSQNAFGTFSDSCIAVDIQPDEAGDVVIACGGEQSSLLRTWNGRFTTSHGVLNNRHLYYDEQGWVHGSHRLTRKGGAEHGVPPVHLAPLLGHYRSYSPWFTNFRIVWHDDSLHLVATGGVEAPTEECLLVELEEGTFRIGEVEWLPERLTVGPIVDGQAVWVIRDGAIYSRAFTD